MNEISDLHSKLYPQSTIEEFNLDFSIAHRIFWKTPIPDFYRAKNVKYHNLPDFFEDENDISLFLTWMRKTGEQRNLENLILQTSKRVFEVREYDRINGIKQKQEEFKQLLLVKFNLKDEKWYFVWSIWWHQVMISHRNKSLSSTVHKLNIWVEHNIWKRVWELDIENIFDRLWFTIEVISWDFYDWLEVMHQINVFMNELWWELKFCKTKTWDFENLIQVARVQNNPELLKSIEKTIYYKKSSTSDSYREIIRPTYLLEWLPIEFKITSDSSKNQHWINFSGLYEYWEKYLKWYAWHYIQKESWILVPSKNQISIASEHFIKNLSEVIEWNPDKKWTSAVSYKYELLNDLKDLWLVHGNAKINDRTLITWVKSYFNRKLSGLIKTQ